MVADSNSASHGCLSRVFVYCLSSDLCEDLITHSGESRRMCMCVRACVCMCHLHGNLEEGDLGLVWAVAPKKKQKTKNFLRIDSVKVVFVGSPGFKRSNDFSDAG